MQGTILIIDGVSTNRIMLKVQLSAAWYHVVQAERLEGCMALIRRTRPNLIISAMTLPDGSAINLRRALAQDRDLADIPVVALTAQNDRPSRIRALEAGIDDVLSQPLDDFMLQARIRGLLRARAVTDALHLHDGVHEVSGLGAPFAGAAGADETGARLATTSAQGRMPGAFRRSGPSGMAEPQADFAACPSSQASSRVVLLTQSATTGPIWRRALAPLLPYQLECCPIRDVHTLMRKQAPDAVVLELPNPSDSIGLRLIADLHARATTREAVIIAVPNPACVPLAAEALDRGAHDVLQMGFCAEELALRLNAQLRRRAFAEQLRNSVRNGLREAMRDPMTGLHNRRYALPQIARIARQAADTHQPMAVMMVDLDHFKQVNDQHGHLAGDAVLIEAARRMRSLLKPSDLISRVGGEEFLIALSGADQTTAYDTAANLCRRINDTPFQVPGTGTPIHVTTSIGLAVGLYDTKRNISGDDIVSDLMHRADQALYAAKNAGRNQVTLAKCAA